MLLIKFLDAFLFKSFSKICKSRSFQLDPQIGIIVFIGATAFTEALKLLSIALAPERLFVRLLKK